MSASQPSAHERGETEVGGGSLSRRQPRRGLLMALLTISFATSLAAMELGLRLWKDDLTGLPDPSQGVSMIGHLYPGSFDPDLGYTPTPGAIALNPVWGTSAHILDSGVRSNGRSRVELSGQPILAVGDSFTYGDEVNDRDTWPAALERSLGRPVVNGGVFGYGFDQIVLRAESLMRDSEADTLVVSLIADDIQRCEYSYRYAWKPYFDLVDGKLVRGNDPVPSQEVDPPGENLLRRALRWSYLADFALRRLDPGDWLVRGSVRVHRRGGEVARALMDRLADAAESDGFRLLIVIQWLPNTNSRGALLAIERARERGIDLLLIEPLLRAAIDASPHGVRDYFNVRSVPGNANQIGHMSAAGNRFIAQAIADRLNQARRSDR